jgi:transposase-like protein
MLTITNLIDHAKCDEMVRQFRWPEGICCPNCTSKEITKRGKDETQPEPQRYRCKQCNKQFDDLTGSVFAGRHQPLRVWVACLYLMGLNLSNKQIAQELDLNQDDVHRMTRERRQAIVAKQPVVQLKGQVECDEVYVTAGHKGQPAAGKKKAAKAVAVNSKVRLGAAPSPPKNRPSLA